MKRPPKQRIGWLGIRKDPTNHTTISTVFLMANYISLLFTADNFFTFEDNEIVGTVTGMTNGLAASATATLLLSLVSFFCIRYPETQTRWGARTLVSILPFIATLYIVSAALA